MLKNFEPEESNALKTSFENKPLVSVIVISYNSSEFIMETLESIKNQTYDNIELIISDDASSDDTVQIAEEWLGDNENRFRKVELITSAKNRGVSGNCNQGVSAANGIWIKLIAADDILMCNFVADNIQYYLSSKDARIILSNVVHFIDKTSPIQIFKRSAPFWGKQKKVLKSAAEQYQALLLSYCGNTPSMIVHREVFTKVRFDERFPFIEDYPFLLNVTRNGFFIHHLDKETVMYRIRPNSVYFGSEQKLFSDFYNKSYFFDREYRYPFLSPLRRKAEIFHFKRFTFLDKWGLNKKTLFHKIIFELSRLFNIHRYLLFLFDRKNF